jgi:putative oxidoreductase
MTSWPSKLSLALRIVLGGVFLYAAWTKLAQPWALFALSIDAYGLLPEGAVIFVARTLPWVEVALGILLLSGKWLRISSPAASAILAVFFVVLVRSYLKGMQIDCGCFGFGEALSPRTLARDGALLAGSLALTALAFRRGSASAPPAPAAS